MSEENKNIITNDNVLSLEQLERYLNYKVGPKERKHIESIIEGDEFYQDALEGIKLSKKGKLEGIVADINADIDSVVAKDKSAIKPLGALRYIAFAASVVLLVSVGWFLMQGLQGNQPTVSEVKEDYKTAPAQKSQTKEFKKEDAEKQDLEDEKTLGFAEKNNNATAKASEKGGKSVNDFFGKTGESKNELKKPASNEPRDADAVPIIEEVEEVMDLVVEDVELEEEEPASANRMIDDETADKSLVIETGDEKYIEDLNKTAVTKASAAKIATNAVQEESVQNLSAIEARASSRGKKKAKRAEKDVAAVATGSGSSAETSLNMGMERFNAGDYTNAANHFESTLKSQSNNRKALYYGGMSYYNVGNDKEAISNLKNLANRDGTYSYSSKFFLSKLYLRNGDNRKAKKILEDISVQPGKFQAESKQLLEKL